MRFNWLHSKLTFLIIPETNKSIVRVKLTRGTLYAFLIGLPLLSGTGLFWYAAHVGTVTVTQRIPSHYDDQTLRLQQDLTNKNKMIEQLQQQIFHLSMQAAEVRSKVEEMKQLEQELRKLTDSEAAGAGEKTIAANAAEEGMKGMGGPANPVSAQQVKALAWSADLYDASQQDMNELHAQWMQSKQSMLKLQEQVLRVPAVWPTLSHTVTSGFGYRKDPFTDKLSFHRGMDIAGKINDPVYAAAKGTAAAAGFDKFHGHHVVIEHGNGLRTWYMHLNRILVKRGDVIERGQQIGKMGTSGRSTGPHLHYEVVRNGKSTNPQPYLPKS